MRKAFLYTVFISFLIINISCNKSDAEKEKDHLNKTINDVKINKNTEWVVILPGLGCTGCIQEAEDFVKKYSNNNKVFFVLTKIESLKILQQKTGVKINLHDNILVDRMDKFIVPTDNCVYPCIVKLENKKYLSHEFQAPNNANAFEKLKTRLSL